MQLAFSDIKLVTVVCPHLIISTDSEFSAAAAATC